ncbi:MAG: hypothetical protein LBH36_01635 [Candidatus Nomurabacteria bacterium]|jgi:hypothetical protein|nr:hypothetical protein [Candidatus Nomurabacteria bacterium]
MAGKQKAGDKSLQVQAETIVVGIDEKRVREIVDEKLQIALQDFSKEANETATNRNGKFNKKLIDRMVKENALSAFADPSFQLLLVEAQKRAASTEREPDYDLLSELMLHRFKKGANRNVRAGISRAVEIVDQISDEALLALTVYHALTYFTPVSGDMEQGLKVLDDLFGKLFYAELPTNTEWLDHLDILDAIRVSSIGSMRSLEDYWYEQFDGYLKKGIEINSENYKNATTILDEQPYLVGCLIKNHFDDNYKKIATLNKRAIKNLFVSMQIPTKNGYTMRHDRKITDEEVTVLEKVYDLYDGQKMTKKDFVQEIEKYPNLKKLRGWWNTLNKQAIQITSVGKVLAHSNAQRVDKTLPPLD